MQRFLDRFGGPRETHMRVARMCNDSINIIDVAAADGTHLASIGWRPHEPRFRAANGLFICG